MGSLACCLAAPVRYTYRNCTPRARVNMSDTQDSLLREPVQQDPNHNPTFAVIKYLFKYMMYSLDLKFVSTG